MLKDTLGVIVFQDQVLEVAMALAGFSAGEAEGLRRAMSRKRSEAAMLATSSASSRERWSAASAQEVAERVFEQVEGFSGFGFPKAHAAAFGLLAYQSTWLRVHYGPEFLCALLNEQPMGFYPPDALVHEAQRRGVEVLGPDVNASELECGVETSGAAAGAAGQPPVGVGLGYVAEVAEADADAVIAERRRGGAYRDVADLAGRSGASRAALLRLAWAGACDRLERPRAPAREAVADQGDGESPSRARRTGRPPRRGDRRGRPPPSGVVGGRGGLAGLTRRGRDPAGAAAGRLPLPRAATAGSLGARRGRLPDDRDDPGRAPDGAVAPAAGRGRRLQRGHPPHPRRAAIRVAGMVTARQRPATAKGVVFMLLEDEHGVINLIVPPPVAERCRMAVRAAGFVIARGRLEHREGTTNVVVSQVERLERDGVALPETAPRSIAPSVSRETGREAGVDPALADARRRGRRVRVGAQRGWEVAGELDRPGREQIVAELAAALPAGHSFGRRGR